VELNLALPFIVIVRVQFTLPKMQEQIILMSDITLLMMLLSKVWSKVCKINNDDNLVDTTRGKHGIFLDFIIFLRN
jgi:hypothetical protein